MKRKLSKEQRAKRKAIVRKNVDSLFWGIKQIWQLGAARFIFWTLLSVGGAIMPAFFLNLLRQVVDNITMAAGAGAAFSQIVIWLMVIGFLMLGQALYLIFPKLIAVIMYERFDFGIKLRLVNFIHKKVSADMFGNKDYNKKLGMTGYQVHRLAEFVASVIGMIGGLASMIALLVLAASISIWLFLVGLLVACWSVYQGARTSLETHPMQKVKGWCDYRRVNVFGLALSEKADIRLLNISKRLLVKWHIFSRALFNLEKRIAQKRCKTQMKIYIVLQTLGVAILGVGLWQLDQGGLTLGGLVLVFGLFAQFVQAAQLLSEQVYEPLSYIKALETLREFFEGEWKEARGPKLEGQSMPPVTPDILFELKDVSYRYNPSTPDVIKNVSIQIRKGEVVALVGGNGAGKSTLVKLMLGLSLPTQGSVLFEGRAYEEVTRQAVLDKVGVVFQDFSKMEMTLQENIGFGCMEKMQDEEAVLEAARLGGSLEIVKNSPKGLKTMMGAWVDPEGIWPSGGQWQRLAVSRGYMNQKDILVMDEPAAALDPLAEMEQFNQLRNRVRGKAAVLVSHRIGFARLADRIAVLDHGELVEMGTHEELIAKNGQYKKLFFAQADWYDTSGEKRGENHV